MLRNKKVGIPILGLLIPNQNPGNLSLWYFLSFLHCFLFVLEAETISGCGRTIGLGILLFPSSVLAFISYLLYAPIRFFLSGHNFGSWNFHFSRNFNERLVQGLVSLLESLILSMYLLCLVKQFGTWTL